MKWPFRQPLATRAKLVQAGVGGPREPLLHPNVVEFRTVDHCLQGLDIRGRVVLLAHLSDVSLAVVEDVQDAG